jgi:hypothetical protein
MMAGRGNNQWTKLQRARSPEAARKLEAWRDRYRAGELIERLVRHARGEVGLSASQIKALEIVLDRLEPRLSAVEQTVHDPDAQKTPEQLLDELGELLKAHPEYVRKLGFVPLLEEVAGEHANVKAKLADGR